MPYTDVSEVPNYVPEDKKKQWLDVFNSAYTKAQSDGKSAKEAEGIAFAEANGVVKKEEKSATPKLERRVFAAQIRADKKEGQRKMVGYAAVYNSDSEDLGGFKEQIAPGAFDRALTEKHDVRALFNHDPNKILGRTKSGTLTLGQDEHGLNFDCSMPDTSYARDLTASLDRGDIDQCSFGFYVRDEKWYDDNGKEVAPWMGSKREIRDLDLFDISAVTYPAYPATSVEARSQFLFPEGRPGTVVAPAEARGEHKTKKVDGVDLPSSCFAYVGDANDTSTWHLPIHFPGDEEKTKTHIIDALARFNQTDGIPASEKEAVHHRIVGAAKSHGIHVSEEKSLPVVKEDGTSEETALALARAKTRMAEIKKLTQC